MKLDLVNCQVGTVLEFLQERFTAGLAPSTLNVYVAAISAYHIPLGGMTLGKDPLVSRFLRGTLRLRPAARTRLPTWDLAIVLQCLSLAPFEPLEHAFQSPDSGPHPNPEGIQSGSTSISYFKSTNYIFYFDKRMLNL